MILRSWKMVHARYWLYELYEATPEFEDAFHRCRRVGLIEKGREGATGDKFTQYVAIFSLSPRTVETGHMFHCIPANRVTH